VLVLVPDLPDRPRRGQELRLRSVIRGLGRLGPVHVHALCHRPTTEAPAWPGLVGWTTSSDPTLTPSRLGASSQKWIATDGGHPTDAWFDPGASEELVAVIRGAGAHTVVLGGLGVRAYADVVRRSVPRVVLDHQNVEADVADEVARLAAPARHVLVRRVLAQRTALVERVLVEQVADTVLVCSEQDARRLVTRYPASAPVSVVPNVVDDLPAAPTGGTGGDRDPVLLYAAAFGYVPNADAARWLAAELWPRMRDQLGGGRLVLAGGHPPGDLVDGSDPSVQVTGRLPDLGPLLAAATLAPVPLRAGGGTRLKVLEALAHGVPVVSTRKGCEGLDVEDGVHVVLADDADRFVQAGVDLHRDRHRRRQLATAGRALVAERYATAAMVAALAAAMGATGPRE
jgi:glycosyltransferase involved in cell wall biosynthesis